MLDYMLGKKVLDGYGIRSVDAKYVKSAEEAVKFADGDKIVLKVISDKAVHKSKEGFVKLGLQEPEDIAAAYNDLEKKGRSMRPSRCLHRRWRAAGSRL